MQRTLAVCINLVEKLQPKGFGLTTYFAKPTNNPLFIHTNPVSLFTLAIYTLFTCSTAYFENPINSLSLLENNDLEEPNQFGSSLKKIKTIKTKS